MSARPGELDLRAADARARLAAQTVFDRPLVLEAGAGTGKTAALVARTVAWCLGPGWERHAGARTGPGSARPGSATHSTAAAVLERVTALTFTEAAAGEMSARVAQALAALGAGSLPTGVDAAALPAPELREERARALLAELERLEVRTIHAWCRRLLSEHALEAELHPAFRVDADGRRTAAVAREVLEARFAAEYAEPGEGALQRLARRSVTPQQVEAALLELIALGVPAAALLEDPASPERLHEVLARGREIAAQWQRAGGAALAAVRGARTQAALGLLEQLAALLASEEGSPAARIERIGEWTAECEPASWKRVADWGSGTLSRGEAEALGELAPAVQVASRQVALWLAPFRAARGRPRPFDPAQLAEVRAALEPLLRAVEEQLRARGVETFGALLRHAHALLARSPAVCAHIRAQIDQLLVDEFQDTDALQCDILRRIALAGPQDSRPGLFLVGDPKQSIYGWREADLAAYERFVAEVCAAGRPGAPGRREALCVNFRSRPAILDEIERLVAPVMHARPGVQPPFRPLLPTTALQPTSHAALAAVRGPDGGASEVEHWVTWLRAADGVLRPPRAAAAARSEAAALASDLVLQHERGVAWSEMALLFRSRGELDVYLEALRRARVPYTVEGHRAYYRRREVVEAAALLRAVADPNDSLALLTWLRSAGAGVPDAALLPLWERGFPERVAALAGPDALALDALAGLVREAAEHVPQVPGLERVADWAISTLAALEALARLRRSLERDPADRFVENLRALSCVEVTESARALGRYRLANLERFFAQLAAELCAGTELHTVLSALRRRVRDQEEEEEGRPVEAGFDTVSVRTIHQAKGLDFGHLYLVQAHKEGRRGSAGETAARQRAGRWEYQLLGVCTPGFAELQAEREETEQAERVRTLYVALTRAKRRLVTVGVWPESTPVRLEDASSHVKLMSGRGGCGVPELAARARECMEQGEVSWIDADGVRWVFPGLLQEREAPRVCAQSEAAMLPGLEAIERESRGLQAARREAELHQLRPRSAAMAEPGPEVAAPPAAPLRRAAQAELFAPVRRHEGARIAAAVGSALHRALEALDLADPEPLRRQLDRQLGAAHGFLLGELGSAAAAAARQSLAAPWSTLAAGQLLERLESLRKHVLARELPVWLPAHALHAGAAAAAPISHFAGVIDLLYRDPQSAELAIADYKTDRVGGEAELAARAARYSTQGRLYRAALCSALELPTPRFELWFLAADRIWVA